MAIYDSFFFQNSVNNRLITASTIREHPRLWTDPDSEFWILAFALQCPPRGRLQIILADWWPVFWATKWWPWPFFSGSAAAFSFFPG